MKSMSLAQFDRKHRRYRRAHPYDTQPKPNTTTGQDS
jgi:hypothetical protein